MFLHGRTKSTETRQLLLPNRCRRRNSRPRNKSYGDISEIEIADVATYPAAGERLTDLKKVNYVVLGGENAGEHLFM